MALIDGISKEAAKALIDELAAQYPPAVLQACITDGLKEALVGRTITVTIEGGAVKVTVG